MTKTFKEAEEEFQEVMKKINNTLIGAKEVEKRTKEIAGNVAFELGKIESEDNIISPSHYASDKGFEVFDVQEAFIHELKGMSASYWCNIVKYILRFQRKNGVEDLKKAKYYLEKLIEEVGE